jgi:hypothetical protein
MQATKGDQMPELQHIVLLEVKADADCDAVAAALAAMRSLSEIEGVLSVDAGPNRSIEGLSADFTHGAVARFADEAARDRYLGHGEHDAVVAQLGALIDGIVVLDIEVEGGGAS